jgi:tetratricopeptide (TPR) repeat protein
MLPLILIPSITAFKPQPDSLIVTSFWWPLAWGVFLFIIPFILVDILLNRILIYFPSLMIVSRHTELFIFLALGIFSFLAVPAAIYNPDNTVIELITLLISSVSIGFLLGNIFDKKIKGRKTCVAFCLLFSMALGFAFLINDQIVLALLASLVILYVTLYQPGIARKLLLNKSETKIEQTIEKVNPIPDETYDNIEINDINGIIKLSENPPYYKDNENYKAALEYSKPFLEGNCVWLFLQGAAGSGKSATANAVIQEMIINNRNNGTVVLKGECRESMNEDKNNLTLYAPFIEAFNEHLNIKVIGNSAEQNKVTDAIVNELINSFIPFSSLLLPPKEDGSVKAASQYEIFTSIKKTILSLAESKGLILLIEDVHWIDESSFELIKYLHKEIPGNSKNRIIFIMTSRLENVNSGSAEIGKHIKIKSLTDEQKSAILKIRFRFNEDVISSILNHIGKGEDTRGDLFWMYHVVSQLARSGAIAKNKNEFGWSEEFNKTKKIPVPEEFRRSILMILKKCAEYREIFECAACIGKEFSVTLLSRCLNITKLKCLQRLKIIEEETGLIYDLRENDDIYAFQSSFVLEVIREELQILGHGPASRLVPQLIKEYHSKVAEVLEKKHEKSSIEIYELASHYYLAGNSNNEKGILSCIEAARTACTVYQFSEAQKYLSMASECISRSSKKEAYEIIILTIECEIAHLSGSGQAATAQKCMEYLKSGNQMESGQLLVFARAFYETRMFREAVETSGKVLNMASSVTQKAEAYHFVGISLDLSLYQERESFLKKAYSLVIDSQASDITSQTLLSRIADSIAGELSRRSFLNGSFDEQTIKDILFYYDLSIGIKSRKEIRDLSGLARSYGGLGRFFLYKFPPEVTKARDCFLKDLEISSQIGDILGQVQMYSNLGACDLLDKDYKNARDNYKKSLELSERITDKVFGLIGLITAEFNLNNLEDCETYGKQVLEINLQNNLPEFCKKEIRMFIENHSDKIMQNWFQELKNRITVRESTFVS